MPAQAFGIKLLTQCGYLLRATLVRTLMTYASEQGSEQKRAFLRRGEKSKMWSERERKDGKGRPGAGGAGPGLTTALWRGAGCAFQHRVYVDSLSLRVCIQIPEPLKTYSITTGIFKNYF